MVETTGLIGARPAAGSGYDDAYERDLPLWCERQAERLREAARTFVGETQPDWANLIEEVEALGRSEQRQVESLFAQALIHLMKLAAEPRSPDAIHWSVEIRIFLTNARETFAPSMRRSLDVGVIYRRAAFQLTGRRTVEARPFGLDDLLEPFPDVAALALKLPARL